MKKITQLALIVLANLFIYCSSAQVMTEVEGDIQISEFTPTLNLFDIAVGENRLEGALFEANNHINLSSYRGDLVFNSANNGSPIERMRILSSGQLGIGTTPVGNVKLTVRSEAGQRVMYLQGTPGGNEDLAIQFNNEGGTHFIFDDADDANSLEFESANALKFNTGGPAQRMEIDENGMIGMNIAGAAFARLRIATATESYATYAQAYGTNTNKYGIFAQAVNYAAANNYYGVYGRASSAGSNSWAGHFDGDICYTGSLVALSDRKVKENITSMSSVLERVMELTPVQYTMKTDAIPGLNLAPGPQVGFLSQDVELIFPDFVHDASHTVIGQSNESESVETDVVIKSLEYMSFIPVLTKAIQEQQEIINQLKTQLNAQQIEIDELKN